MNLRIPALLEEHLRGDRSLRAVVDDALAEFDEWLGDSKLPFFPDYTDHGASHLSGVLATAAALITPQAIGRFSTADAAVLILATLFHDSAMHLSEAGFYELIRGSFTEKRIVEFDQASWPELWENFFYSAKRWDDRQLIAIFGEAEPGVPRAYVSDPFQTWNNLTEAHRRFIGEFIRRYHARLAHEFAVFGIPGVGGSAIELSPKLSTQLRDIAGVVARSHGLPPRACLDYLAHKHHRRETQNCHAVYLMTLLRVADFLQVDASRSPAIVFRYKHIPSRVSQLEHRAHQAVVNITTTGDDPESIEIQAEPQDAATFLRLKDWLTGMQWEIDASWAVLGEVYGAQSELADLGLRFRRVRSNLDDVKRFSQQVAYLPERVRFDVARSELLKLLIRPLYGGKPSVGIRELMQNAVDAVRELHELQKQHPELKLVTLREQEADIEVWLDEPDHTGFATFTISDRGIGMDAIIVRDYFLRAGASYRQSERWRELFEHPASANVPFHSKSRVLRSGRFGVGVLAAFLLGDCVRVLTRHARDSEGLQFEATLEADVIEVSRVRGCPVGTLLQVRVPRETHDELRQQGARVAQPAHWDWYQFSYPSVRRYVGRERQLLEATPKTDIGDTTFTWNKLPVNLPYSVYWTYAEAPALSCNGIFVRNSEAIRRFPQGWNAAAQYSFVYPNIMILDPDALFPLTLQRDQFDGDEYPFWQAMVQDITEYSFAQILRHLPEVADLRSMTRAVWNFVDSTGFYFDSSESSLVWIGCALSIYEEASLAEQSVQRLVLVGRPNDTSLLPLEHEGDAVFWVTTFTRFYIKETANGADISVRLAGSDHEVIGVRVATKYRNYKERIERRLFENRYSWNNETKVDLKNEIERRFSLVDRHDRWCVVETENCPVSTIDWSYLSYIEDIKDADDFALVEVFLKEPLRFNIQSGIVGLLWRENFERGAIPIDPSRRESMLKNAYAKLSRFLPKSI